MDSSILINFVNLIKTTNIIFIILASLISNRLVDFGNTFIDCLIIPLFHKNKLIKTKDDHDDGIESKYIIINGYYFKIGRLLVSLIRLCMFIIITIIIYYIFLKK